MFFAVGFQLKEEIDDDDPFVTGQIVEPTGSSGTVGSDPEQPGTSRSIPGIVRLRAAGNFFVNVDLVVVGIV